MTNFIVGILGKLLVEVLHLPEVTLKIVEVPSCRVNTEMVFHTLEQCFDSNQLGRAFNIFRICFVGVVV